jgi:hypothetical protein
MLRNRIFPALVAAVSIVGGASVLAFQERKSAPTPAGGIPSEASAAAQTYEDLATAIIAIEKTEDELVKTILIGYHTAAQRQLRMALREGADKKAAFEAAANQISNIANEGDKAIRAVRQRLAQAGHTHNTDVETKEDYMFISSREKRDLLAFAQKVAQMGADTSSDAVRQAGADLQAMVARAIAPE